MYMPSYIPPSTILSRMLYPLHTNNRILKWAREKRGAHKLVHGDAKAAPVTGTTLRTTDTTVPVEYESTR